MNFAQAALSGRNMGTTLNGGVTNKSSGSSLVDLFFLIGASRSNPGQVVSMFGDILKSGNANLIEKAMRIAAWARDCRGGAGERNIFRELIRAYPNEMGLLVPIISDIGRADDILVFLENDHLKSPGHRQMIADYYFEMTLDPSVGGLFAKWAPRKGPIAAELTKRWSMTPKQYRRHIVDRSNTVEQRMCAKTWHDINYEHVPSVAMARYMKAFFKNDHQRFSEYKESLVKGTATIKADVLFPHDVIRSLRGGGDHRVAEAQWNALPNFLEGNNAKILPMVDVSGSMDTPVSGSITAMDVSVAMGMYLASKATGPFKDMMLTFTDDARFVSIADVPFAKQHDHVMCQGCGYNTNFEKAYRNVLAVAVENNLPQSELPDVIIVFSDMEFDPSWCGRKVRAFEHYQKLFKDAGYVAPKMVFWNLNGRRGNSPAQVNEMGVSLVSGFSPAILKSILKCDGDMKSEAVMLDAIMIPRYNIPGFSEV